MLEWTQFYAGPFCGKLLATLGAEVVKIEPPGAGDPARSRGPFPNDEPDPEKSAQFLFLNTDKKSITLDPATGQGKELFKKLVAKADILVQEQPPALVDSLGLTWDVLKAVNPGLIVAALTSFGQSGPYRDYKSYFLTDFHGGGLGYCTPFEPLNPRILEREPLTMGGLTAEYHCGLNAAVAAAAALYARMLGGGGQYIDLSKQETALNAQRPDVARFLDGSPMASRAGSSIPGAVRRTSGILRCLDGYVNLHVSEDQLPGLFDLMGNPDWTREERFKPENLAANRQELDNRVEEWAKDHEKEFIFHGAQQRGIPVAAIYSVAESAGSEHLRERGFFVELDHPQAGRLKYPGVPFRLSGTPARLDHAAPLLGEHNEEVYCQTLGLRRADLAKLKKTGAI